jgi:probable HAF family extracellular repeat protein
MDTPQHTPGIATMNADRSRICMLLLGAAVASAAAPGLAAPSFSVQDLGTLGTGRVSDGSSVNALGHVAGDSRTSPTALFHAFLWSDGALTDLGTLGGVQSHAHGVNGSDQVVGDADIFDPFAEIRHAFLWQNGGMVDIGTLGGIESVATAINADGTIVGFSDLSPSGSHAFEWKAGLMTDLGVLPGDDFSAAAAINDGGVIVGSSTHVNFSQVFVYRNGVMRGLPELGDLASSNGINDHGQIIATSFDYGDLAWHALLWRRGVVTDLGRVPDGTNSYAYGINDAGQVVGVGQFVRSGSDIVDHAFLWRRGHMYDLNDLIPPGSGWELTHAISIADGGAITGTGQIGGETHAYLLLPVRAGGL